MNISTSETEMQTPTFIPIKDRPITTMVVICGIDSLIDIPKTFLMLPITYIEIPENKKKSKTVQIPHVETPGSILSMRYRGITRGAITKVSTKSTKHFKNSITIDMSISEKNVNLRLSTSTIHICGIKSENQIQETVNLIFDHLNILNTELIYIRDNPNDTLKCVRYIKMNLNNNKGILSIATPTDELKLNLRIFRFLMRNLREYASASVYLEEISYLVSIPAVCRGPLTISKIETSMVNLNYDIGYEINRRELADILKTSYPELIVDYDNTLNHSVKVRIPFEIPEGMKIRRKKKKNSNPCHTFMIYKSGRVTQSGPCLELMEQIYIRFFEIMEEIRQNKLNNLDLHLTTDSQQSEDASNLSMNDSETFEDETTLDDEDDSDD